MNRSAGVCRQCGAGRSKRRRVQVDDITPEGDQLSRYTPQNAAGPPPTVTICSSRRAVLSAAAFATTTNNNNGVSWRGDSGCRGDCSVRYRLATSSRSRLLPRTMIAGTGAQIIRRHAEARLGGIPSQITPAGDSGEIWLSSPRWRPEAAGARLPARS